MKQDNNALIAVIIIIIVLALFGSFGMMGYGGGMMSGFYSGFGFMWLFMTALWILIIVALVLFIAWLVKQLQK